MVSASVSQKYKVITVDSGTVMHRGRECMEILVHSCGALIAFDQVMEICSP